jgi:hypothetical protein
MKRLATVLIGMVLALQGLPAWAQQSLPDADRLEKLLETLQQQLAVQQQQIDALKKQIEALRQSQAPTAATAQPSPQATPTPAPGVTVATVSPSITERSVLNQDPNAAARLDNAPIDPELKGFIPIPGTSSRFRFGGYAKLDFIHDFQPAGDPNAFVTSTIPTEPLPNAQDTFISARQTRLSLDFRRPTDWGELRMYYENDFWGPDGTMGYHLRHAYGQVSNILAGYTYSALLDVDSLPDTLDFEGPGSAVYMVQPGIRLTLPLDKAKDQTFAIAVEQGTSDIVTSIDNPDVTITPTSPWPDTILRYRWDGAASHIQAGAVLRSVGGYATGKPDHHVFGWGLSLSGGTQVAGQDNVLYQLSGGPGLGRYIEDVTGLAADVGVNSHGELEALKAYSGFVAYQHYWSSDLRSTATYGYARVDSKGYTYTTDFYSSDYVAANLIWNPKGTAFNIGIEYLYGDHTTSSGGYGRANRVQLSFQYDLLRLTK